MVKWRKEQVDAAVRERQLVEEGHRQQRQNGAAEQEERKKGERAITKMTGGEKDTADKGVALGLVVEEEDNGGGNDGKGGGVYRGEKTYPGRDLDIAWLFREDVDDDEGRPGGKGEAFGAARVDGSGENGPVMVGGSGEDGEYWFEEAEPDGERGVMRCRQEREDQEYGKIVNRLMQHWVGLAVKGKLQWYLVRRRWFGLVVMQFYGMEEGLFRSGTFERTWKKYDGDWEEELKNMGALEGWKRHCGEHGCCGQEGQREWNDVVASW